MAEEKGLVDVIRMLAEGDPSAVEAAASLVRRALERVEERVAAAVEAIASGAAMVLHDAADLGLLDRVHHWIIGLLLLILALVALLVSLLIAE